MPQTLKKARTEPSPTPLSVPLTPLLQVDIITTVAQPIKISYYLLRLGSGSPPAFSHQGLLNDL